MTVFNNVRAFRPFLALAAVLLLSACTTAVSAPKPSMSGMNCPCCEKMMGAKGGMKDCAKQCAGKMPKCCEGMKMDGKTCMDAKGNCMGGGNCCNGGDKSKPMTCKTATPAEEFFNK